MTLKNVIKKRLAGFGYKIVKIPRSTGNILVAILRLDGDWYQSTKISLDYLYHKVVRNGIVIIDDYGYNTGCKKAVDEFLAEKKVYPILNYINNTCRYFIKQ